MALPASGNSISLDQIHVELGESSGGTVALGDDDVRALASDTSGAIGMDQFFGLSAVDYWFTSFTGAGEFDATATTNLFHGQQHWEMAHSPQVGPNGEVYVTAWCKTGGYNYQHNAFLMLPADGTKTGYRHMEVRLRGATSGFAHGSHQGYERRDNSITSINSSNEFFSISWSGNGSYNDTNSSVNQGFSITKIIHDSSNAARLDVTSGCWFSANHSQFGTRDSNAGVLLDGSNLIVPSRLQGGDSCISVLTTSFGSPKIAVYSNTSTATRETPRDIIKDGSNYLTCGLGYESNNTAFVYRFGISGTTPGAGVGAVLTKANIRGTCLARDSSGNIFLAGEDWGNHKSGGGNSFCSFVAKFNSSFAIQWQKVIGSGETGGGETGYFVPMGLKMSGSNVILMSNNDGGVNSDLNGIHLCELASSNGAIQWQRNIEYEPTYFGNGADDANYRTHKNGAIGTYSGKMLEVTSSAIVACLKNVVIQIPLNGDIDNGSYAGSTDDGASANNEIFKVTTPSLTLSDLGASAATRNWNVDTSTYTGAIVKSTDTNVGNQTHVYNHSMRFSTIDPTA